jgi:3D (Asp-Asp-Asp) domain-containing protein
MVSKEKKILEDNIKYLQDLDINSMRVPKPTSLNRGGTVPNINTIKVRATGYGAYEGGTGTCKTKMGTTPIQGKTIAVDPRVIPLGSEVYVFCKDYPEVNGWHVAEDIGGAIKGNKIDVYFDDIHTPRSVANKTIAQFGVRDVTLYIMKK